MKTRQSGKFFESDKKQIKPKKIISNIIVIGDSISDRGIFYGAERYGTKLVRSFNMINQSPSGRFTNGLTWVDYLATNIINQFTIDEVLDQKVDHKYDYLDLELPQNQSKKYIFSTDDFADHIVSKNKQLKKTINSYSLNDPREITYQGNTFVRSYSEAGLCNHNFGFFSKSITMIATRIIVPYLSDKIHDIKKDDENRTQQNKEETLSIIWSGMNDIGLVNVATEAAYKKKVRLSIISIRKNIKELIESGYHNFLLFNMPDITLSPRYKTTIEPSLKPLKGCITSFNFNLRRLVGELKYRYPHCSFELYDANALLKKIINNPELYGLDKTKVDKTYLSSPDFKPITKTGDFQHSPGYLFWDEAHPTTFVHEIIAREVQKMIQSIYLLKPPKNTPTKIMQTNTFSI